MGKTRKKNNTWNIKKFKGDGAYYAYCNCGWRYCCGDVLMHREVEKWTLFNYCPVCGAHKTNYTEIEFIDKYQWEYESK